MRRKYPGCKCPATIGGKYCEFRSVFERDWAAYLELLKRKGEIRDWFYEVKRFSFSGPDIADGLQGKHHGVRWYRPDFKVILNDKTLTGEYRHTWHETKGYLDRKDKTRLRCFHRYYPDEPLVLVMQNLPLGRTAKGRRLLREYDEVVSPLGYQIVDGGRIVKQHGATIDFFSAHAEHQMV